MKTPLLCLCILFLVRCATATDIALTEERSFNLVEPIHATYVGIFRDGGTVQIALEGSKQKSLKIYIDHSISTSQNSPKDYGALWINAYPKKDGEKQKGVIPATVSTSHTLRSMIKTATPTT